MASRFVQGVPRRYPDHRTRKAQAYREEYRRLEILLGGAVPEVFRQDVATAADLFVEYTELASLLQEVQTTRATGRGRRPPESRVMRLMKRKSLTQNSYHLARERLVAALASYRERTETNDWFATAKGAGQ